MYHRSISVTKLNNYTNSLLKEDPVLSGISVTGEIAGYKKHSSGHIYFTLKDSSAAVNCSYFRQYNYALEFDLRDGMLVEVVADAGIYERDGKFQLYVYGVKQAGRGDILLKLEELKKRLEAEGLFDREQKRPLPYFASRIGVVTSPTGAVIRDIINVSRRRFNNVGILLAPVLVQGEGAPESIARGIKYIGTQDVDVVIVGRGGGSVEDLWAFNSEEVVRAIRDCPAPVISAVGHETDYTLADLAADMRAPTPSAAAELAVKERSELEQELAEYGRRALRAAQNGLNGAAQRIKLIRRSLDLLNPQGLVISRRKELEGYGQRLIKCLDARLNGSELRLEALKGRAQAGNPLNVLSRGYALVYEGERLMKGPEQVEKGALLDIRLAGGVLRAKAVKSEED